MQMIQQQTLQLTESLAKCHKMHSGILWRNEAEDRCRTYGTSECL